MSIFDKIFGSKTEQHQVGTVIGIDGKPTTKATKASKKYSQGYAEGNKPLSKKAEENYLHTSELVYSSVDYISKAASQAVPVLKKKNSKGELEEVTDSKLLAWIASPNSFHTWGEYIELTIQGLLLSGNSFMSHEMVQGRFETWHLGAPSAMKVVPDKTKFIKGYIYLDKVPYNTTEVIHFKNPTINNIFYGVPAVRPLLDTLVLEGEALNELKQFYEGSTILGGVIQSEFPLSPEQITDLRNQFKELYGKGSRERGGTAVLPAGMKYQTVQATPKDAMLLDTLAISEKRVTRLFKINPIALGGEAQSTSHPQELMKATFNTAVRPYLYKIQQQLTVFLQTKFKDPSLVFYFDLDNITELETPLETKANSAKTLYSTGIASLNEARDFVGLPKVDSDNADKHILASYLFGNDARYIEDGQSPLGTPTDTTSTPTGSTDPQGGTADGVTTDNTSTNK